VTQQEQNNIVAETERFMQDAETVAILHKTFGFSRPKNAEK
jgi:hypothetical protein